ncbi:hypothetical protein [Microbacterium sp. No. 7]|uniref:hypothetical protein n=1 Tax=Microbacterium sp. No. 7 TaxID=1714373 RepID=UPI0006D178E3|nr:hypothetical protein [Microbacterium sp. No. 7]ALJ21533.1 hypothetical protein AOA12_17205 [Microbacterium sp. No. 7]
MSGSEQFYPPAQYGPVWLVWLLVAIAALLVVAWLLLRRRPEPPAAPPPAEVAAPAQPVAPAPQTLRSEYLARIDLVEILHKKGQLDKRAAHLELSRLVRQYVNEHSGLEAPVLTLSELRARGVHPSLVDAMRKSFYPGSFEERPSRSVRTAVSAARRVVNTWR